MIVAKYSYMLLTAIMLAACQTTQTKTQSTLTGSFHSTINIRDESISMLLDCRGEQCKLNNMSVSKKNGHTSQVVELDKITPVASIEIANNALAYTVGHRNSEQQKPLYSVLIEKLKPVLDTNPSIYSCWDLNHPTPNYTLVCTLVHDQTGTKTIYLFSTLATSCNNAFCRYVIFPMERL